MTGEKSGWKSKLSVLADVTTIVGFTFGGGIFVYTINPSFGFWITIIFIAVIMFMLAIFWIAIKDMQHARENWGL